MGGGQIIFVRFAPLKLPDNRGLVYRTVTKDDLVVALDETKPIPTSKVELTREGNMILQTIIIRMTKKDYDAAQECLPGRIIGLFIEKPK